MRTIVIIDSSYYNFYRATATISWYNWDQARVAAAEGVHWLDNKEFMEKFEKMWFETLRKIQKRLNAETRDLIFVRDGRKVWRYKVFPEYKANRSDTSKPDDDPHTLGPIFKHVNENYHRQLDEATVIRFAETEGDDLAAITTKYIRAVNPKAKIAIITGDHDFLQLSKPNKIELYKLGGKKDIKCITVQDPNKPLMMKILNGDPSDGIPPVFKGCGKKTAEKLIADPDLLKCTLDKKGWDQYNLNQLLINFDNIPKKIVQAVEEILDEKIYENIKLI